MLQQTNGPITTKLSRLNGLNCYQLHTPQIYLFATRFNKKLSLFVSLVKGKEAWAVDALSISWEDMDGYAFYPTPLIANVINKISSHDCRWIIVNSDLSVPTFLTQSFDSTIQKKLAQTPTQSEPPCFAPRSSESKVFLVKGKVAHFCLMVQIKSGGLQIAIYNSNS